MILNSLRPGADIVRDPLGFDPATASFGAYRSMIDTIPIGLGFLNTAIVLVGRGAITMVFCPLAGYGFAKYSFRGKRVLFAVLLVTLMMPTLALIIPLLLEMGTLGWVNTYQALILPGSIEAFSVFWMRQVIENVPDDLLDAARIDGCSELGIFTRIIVPVIRPGLAALAVLTFINVYNDFVWPVVVTNDDRHQTLQVMLSTLAQNISSGQLGTDYGNVWGQTLAASTLASLPVLIFFIVLQRHFVNGLMAGSFKA
jgi:multiple sugar transport system permease protein